jgi:hypothetical protein
MGHAPPCTPSKLQLTEEILDICPEGLDRFRRAMKALNCAKHDVGPMASHPDASM